MPLHLRSLLEHSNVHGHDLEHCPSSGRQSVALTKPHSQLLSGMPPLPGGGALGRRVPRISATGASAFLEGSSSSAPRMRRRDIDPGPVLELARLPRRAAGAGSTGGLGSSFLFGEGTSTGSLFADPASNAAAGLLKAQPAVHAATTATAAAAAAAAAAPSGSTVSENASFMIHAKSKTLMELIESAPPEAVVSMHIASIMAAFPGTVAFELAEGYTFGFTKGFALAFSAKALGAGLSFGLARSALVGGSGLCESLREKLKCLPVARAAAAGAERGGAFFVFVVRLSPMPCFVNNYAIALLTDIPWAVYMPASLVGLLPMTAANVYAGSLAPGPVAATVGHTALVSPEAPALQLLAGTSSILAAGLLSWLAGCYLHTLTQVQSETPDDTDAADTESEAEGRYLHTPAQVQSEPADETDAAAAEREAEKLMASGGTRVTWQGVLTR